MAFTNSRLPEEAAQRPSRGAHKADPATAAHTHPVRVYYEDTDAAGIVYYANYLKFAERGRTEMMRGFGLEHRSLGEAADTVFTVRRCTVDYRVPARLDDALTVETRVCAIGGATLSLDQRICRGAEIVAALDVLLACVSRAGRPRRVPPALRAALTTDRDKSSQAAPVVQKTP